MNDEHIRILHDHIEYFNRGLLRHIDFSNGDGTDFEFQGIKFYNNENIGKFVYEYNGSDCRIKRYSSYITEQIMKENQQTIDSCSNAKKRLNQLKKEEKRQNWKNKSKKEKRGY